MKKILATLALLACGASQAATVTSTVDTVRPGGDRTCLLFTLSGVTQADPAVSGPWFAIPSSAPGYKEMVSTLLLAKSLGLSVYVATTGSAPSECLGIAGVAVIQAQ